MRKIAIGFVVDSDNFGLEKYFKSNDFSWDFKGLKEGNFFINFKQLLFEESYLVNLSSKKKQPTTFCKIIGCATQSPYSLKFIV